MALERTLGELCSARGTVRPDPAASCAAVEALDGMSMAHRESSAPLQMTLARRRDACFPQRVRRSSADDRIRSQPPGRTYDRIGEGHSSEPTVPVRRPLRMQRATPSQPPCLRGRK
jgi:hypothetical protein